jgi:hypothetical protein
VVIAAMITEASDKTNQKVGYGAFFSDFKERLWVNLSGS